MDATNSLIRHIAKDLVVAFAQHIKRQVQEKNYEYIDLGIDSDIDSYTDFFKATAGKILGVKVGILQFFPNFLIVETLDVLNQELLMKGYTAILDNDNYSGCVYEVCTYILKKVKEDVFEDLTYVS